MEDTKQHLTLLALPMCVVMGYSLWSAVSSVASRLCTLGRLNLLLDGFLFLTIIHQIYHCWGLWDATTMAQGGFGGYLRLFLLPLLMAFGTQVLTTSPPDGNDFAATLARLQIYYLVAAGMIALVVLQGFTLWHQPVTSGNQALRLSGIAMFLVHVFVKNRIYHVLLLGISTVLLLTYIIIFI